MSDRYIAAAVQMNSGEDKQANLARAEQLVGEAVSQNASLVALPEMFNCLGRFATVVQNAETIPGPTSERMAALARRLRIVLLAGSICEQCGQSGKAYNTSLLFSADGQLLARYRKIHLFDVDLPDKVTVQESRWILPGQEIGEATTPLGQLGLSVCYDLRFAELYRSLAAGGANVLCVPSAFTHATGRHHWQVLLRARAIENQAYVIAPNQCGQHGPELKTYGHSMIVDPWGRVLTSADEDEQVVVAEIDLEYLREVRAQLPALTHRKGHAGFPKSS
jgi:predicted amidohydrolase